MTKVVCLLSGGMDSTTLVGEMIREYGQPNVFCLFFDYGSKHNRTEITQAVLVASEMGISEENMNLFVLPLSDLKGSTLTDEEKHIPSAEEGRQTSTVVPGRNMILLSFGVAYAQTLGALSVLFGACKDDYISYPDCRLDFVENLSSAALFGYKVCVEAPYATLTKAEIIKLGLRYEVPYHLTHTCYKGTRPACGVCDACIERINGFKANGVIDPIEYASEAKIDWGNCLPFSIPQPWPRFSPAL